MSQGFRPYEGAILFLWGNVFFVQYITIYLFSDKSLPSKGDNKSLGKYKKQLNQKKILFFYKSYKSMIVISIIPSIFSVIYLFSDKSSLGNGEKEKLRKYKKYLNQLI